MRACDKCGHVNEKIKVRKTHFKMFVTKGGFGIPLCNSMMNNEEYLRTLLFNDAKNYPTCRMCFAMLAKVKKIAGSRDDKKILAALKAVVHEQRVGVIMRICRGL